MDVHPEKLRNITALKRWELEAVDRPEDILEYVLPERGRGQGELVDRVRYSAAAHTGRIGRSGDDGRSETGGQKGSVGLMQCLLEGADSEEAESVVASKQAH